MEGGTAAIRANVAQLKDAGVPVAGLWVQDWTGVRTDSFGTRLWWNWEVDEECVGRVRGATWFNTTLTALLHDHGVAAHRERRYYWDWSGLLANLNASGIRMLTYINPNLANNVAQLKPNFRRCALFVSTSSCLLHTTA